MTRMLVTGGRDYHPADVWNWLERDLCDAIAERFGERAKLELLIHGGARGADEGAAEWGKSEDVRVVCYSADWKKHGKAAGPLRNARMIKEGRPDLVVAFPGGRGTADCVKQARAAGIEVIEVHPLSGRQG